MVYDWVQVALVCLRRGIVLRPAWEWTRCSKRHGEEVKECHALQHSDDGKQSDAQCQEQVSPLRLGCLVPRVEIDADAVERAVAGGEGAKEVEEYEEKHGGDRIVVMCCCVLVGKLRPS